MLSMTRYTVKNERLAPMVKFIWHFEAKNANIHSKLLPTDCIDVIINLSNNMIYETDSQKIIAPPFHVNGLRNKYSYIHQTGTIQIFGISFYSFGLFPFVHKSLEHIQNKIVDLHTLSIPLAHKLKLAVSNNTADDTILIIEKMLFSELQVNNDYMSNANLINDFIETDENITIQSFCKEYGINIKTFERMVLRYTGYTPKTLKRIKRFQAASNQLIHQNPENLSDVAYDNSFADQAHLIKEFRKFSGTAPRALQQEKSTIKENTNYSYI